MKHGTKRAQSNVFYAAQKGWLRLIFPTNLGWRHKWSSVTTTLFLAVLPFVHPSFTLLRSSDWMTTGIKARKDRTSGSGQNVVCLLK